MKIVEGNIALQSSHVRESRQSFTVERSQRFQAVYAEARQERSAELEARARQMLVGLLEAILAALTGRKCREAPLVCRDETPTPAPRESQVEWRVDIRESESEYVCTTVSGKGCIATADGRRIEFDYGLMMERSRVSERAYGQSGHYTLHDPLVLNFAGRACDLRGARFDFDLDADGRRESIPSLGDASAYLALDCNGNGVVDDGSELFGTQSGDGFADLAQYDSDGNGWIDQGDPVFARLSLWTGGPTAAPLKDLAAAGVGAIWLGAVDSPFALKDAANELLGEIRASGLWLAEDGQVGSVQQVDLATDGAPPSRQGDAGSPSPP